MLKFYSLAASIIVSDDTSIYCKNRVYTAASFACHYSKEAVEWHFREVIRNAKGVYPIEMHTIEMPLYQPLIYLLETIFRSITTMRF